MRSVVSIRQEMSKKLPISQSTDSIDTMVCYKQNDFYEKMMFCYDDDDIRCLLWIAQEPQTFRQSVGCSLPGVHSETSNYYKIAFDELIQSSNSHK